ncbi:MAG: PilZ domain-containing protein [Pseudomonadota bacterium]
MNMQTGTGMMYEGILSLMLGPVAMLPPPNLLSTINESNEVLLDNVLLLDEKKHDHDESDEVMQELKRQDLKMKLILELLSMLLVQNQLLPAAGMVRFSGETVSVPAAGRTEFPKSSWVQLSLYIDPALPKPLTLFATAMGNTEEFNASGNTDGGPEIWQQYQLQGLSQPVQDKLEKLIFRQHRKTVAQSKRLAAAG